MKKILSVLFLSVIISISILSKDVKACYLIDYNTGGCIVNMGDGDLLNTSSGEYIMDLGNGDKIGTNSGDLYINFGDGDLLNTESGSLLIK